MMHCNMLRIKPPTYGQDPVTFSKVFHVKWNSVSLPAETESNGVICMMYVCQRLTLGSAAELWSDFLSVFLHTAQRHVRVRIVASLPPLIASVTMRGHSLALWHLTAFALIVVFVSLAALCRRGRGQQLLLSKVPFLYHYWEKRKAVWTHKTILTLSNLMVSWLVPLQDDVRYIYTGTVVYTIVKFITPHSLSSLCEKKHRAFSAVWHQQPLSKAKETDVNSTFVWWKKVPVPQGALAEQPARRRSSTRKYKLYSQAGAGFYTRGHVGRGGQ